MAITITITQNLKAKKVRPIVHLRLFGVSVTVYANPKRPEVGAAAASAAEGRAGRDAVAVGVAVVVVVAVAVVVVVARDARGCDGGCGYGSGHESGHGRGCGCGCGRLPIESAGSQIVFGRPWITP
jgi:hypothetical protein